MSILIEAAPIAGYTDQAFRRTLIKCGAKVVYTEMVSATAIFYGNKKTLELLAFDKVAGVKTVVQLFGSNPEHFVFAIKSGHLDEFDEININMGCPAPKIVKNSEGSALMRTPGLAYEIVKACVGATDKPVTVKMRLGFELDNFTADKFAQAMQQAGASRIIVHGRYTAQGYSGTANWEKIAKVVNSVSIPVIANGDIVDEQSAKKCLEVTGASGVMMARGLFGKPWAISNKNLTLDEKKSIMNFHIQTAKDLGTSFYEMKKHLLSYCELYPNSKELKRRVALMKSYDELKLHILDL